MKEYKLITVKLDYQEDGTPAVSGSLTQSVKAFFFADDGGGGHFLTDKAERLMQEMNRDGWEVVSAAPYGTAEGMLLITFSREM